MANAGRQLAIGLIAVLALVAGAIGCGAGDGGQADGSHPDYAAALAGAPAPLAALHRQADELLPGGLDAYEERVAALRGYPVVVNVWASWCGPCRFEFPTLQQLSAEFGKRVAFLGVNTQDSDQLASNFLAEAPVPYPSFSDPGKEIANEIGGRALPDTAFYDRGGELVYLKQGPYTDDGELRADIQRYALADDTESG